MADKELQIGETFQYERTTLRCELPTNGCKGCFFEHTHDCFNSRGFRGLCTKGLRDDSNDVIFVEVDDNEPKPTPATETNSIDWEQRRYEIAKEVFLYRLKSSPLTNYKDDAKDSVIWADTLISELKKGCQNG